MKKSLIPLLLMLSILLSACFALEAPEASSGAVSAPTVAAVEALQAVENDAAANAAESVPETAAAEGYPAPQSAPAALPEAYPAGEEPQAPELPPTPDPYPDAAAEPAVEEAAGTDSQAVYEIDPARSEARFTINEVLRGAPTTVVGTTSNLGGQIALDLANPGAAQIGAIVINARDLRTDNDFRNNAIANEILHTNQFEFITFEPTAISGLPETAVAGETYPLAITGNLTITDQTREVTFDAEVTPLSENELQGTAVLDILYADFGLTIPFARSVEAVEDNVLLEIDFIAAK